MTTEPAVRRPSAMDKPMTRRGCVLGVALWLLVMILPCCAFVLAMRGEVSWRRGEFVEDRLWLVSGEGGSGLESASGLGYSGARVISGQPGRDAQVCVRTRVYFWLWRGSSEALDYCECYHRAASGAYESAGNCP